MEKKQTAVEWLENILHDFIHPEHGAEFFPFVQKAKAMEKEQIEESFKNGRLPVLFGSFKAEDYYNETYGK